MDKINYLSYSSNLETKQGGKYPVTIQGLDFIQKQLLQLQTLSFVGGDYYLLKPSANAKAGVCVIDGEVLPLSGVKGMSDTHLKITTISETIRTDSGDYENVREIRVAQYCKYEGAATYQDATWIPLTLFTDFAPNAELLKRINDLAALIGEGFLPSKTGVYDLVALNKEKSATRISCKTGSFSVAGNNAYTVDVYVCGAGVIYQELRTQDSHRMGRYFNPSTGLWGDFQSLDEQMQIEAKIVRGSLYMRHGFLPSYARIILLRKKRRGKNAGSCRPNRSPKKAWYHGYNIVLSQSEPNTWYVPKCVSGEISSTYTGKEMFTVIDQLLFCPKTGKHPYESIAGVDRSWGRVTRGYARLAIAVIAHDTYRVPANSMLRLKYRLDRGRRFLLIE